MAGLCTAQTPAAGSTQTANSAPASTESKTASEPPAARASEICRKTEIAFSRDNDAAQAWNGFVAATQADPSYAPAYFNLGIVAEIQKKWKPAEDSFQRYLALAPNGQDAVRAAEQIELLKKYISGEVTDKEIRQSDYDAAIERARVLLAAGQYREAITDAGQAQSIDANRWEAYAVVSLAMYKQHKNDEGKRFADMALTRTPAEKKAAVAEALVPLP